MTLPPAPAAPDWIEIRVDAFADVAAALDPLVQAAPRPLLITVRDASEGGLAALDAARRAALYRRFMGHASAIDVEVTSLTTLRDPVAQARESGAAVVASFHDLFGAPPLSRLRELAAQARDAGADLFKAAITVNSPGDLAVLFALLEAEPGFAMSVMGMGRLGRASRPALAAAGSVLNYGFLGAEAQVAGQWPVATLRARIDELAG